jgi:molecular chaperone GrpE
MTEPKPNNEFSSLDSHNAPAQPEAVNNKQTGDQQAKIDTLQAELDKSKDQMLRALAEAENARKRSIKDRDDASKYAVSSFAKDLLNVADNLRRALGSVPEDLLRADPRLKNLVDGIEATEREMLKAFEKTGIRKIQPDGELFNPNYHEVMFESPGSGKPPGTIVTVIDSGYMLHDRLLRPARVGVAKDEGQSGPPGGNIDTKA